jgi:guanine deaminase
MIAQIVRGPLLVPRENGSVEFFSDGALACDERGILMFVGEYARFASETQRTTPLPLREGLGEGAGDDRETGALTRSEDPHPSPLPQAGEGTGQGERISVRASLGVMMPPLIDLHIHIPQHPIRGHFVDGIPDDAPGGKLLNGLQKNVFPAEARCHDAAVAKAVVDAFAHDTLSHGVVGGCAYMMVNARATDIALAALPYTWSVGMVLMNQNSPDDLITNEPTLESDITAMARRYGSRVVVTDRFAVAVDSRLRSRASKLAATLGLRTQTHLNEQVSEKKFVELDLYPDAGSYTNVYLRDGLLDHRCILAHCIHMREAEWSIVRDTGSVVAHCPTSNLLLGSGRMDLDAVIDRQIPYAIATDVGASPTVSMLAEMGRFLSVHHGHSTRATPAEVLFRATLAPAQILGMSDRVGDLSVGKPMSFIEVEPDLGEWRFASAGTHFDTDDVIRSLLPADLDNPKPSVNRVTLAGKIVYDRGGHA